MAFAVAAVILCVVALAHTAPFPFLLDAAAGKVSVWRMPESAGLRTVYLTFDDGPNPTVTPQLLDLLRRKNTRATFFLIDTYVTEETAPIVRRMFDEGHGVGLHSDNRWLMLRSSAKLAAKLQSASDSIELLTGRRPCPLFRPHAGWRSISMLRGVSRAGHKLAGWSWQSWDWCWFRQRTGPRVASQVINHAAPGKIIVIHDGHHSNPRADRLYALEAAGLIIDGLRSRGYEFAPLCGSDRRGEPDALSLKYFPPPACGETPDQT